MVEIHTAVQGICAAVSGLQFLFYYSKYQSGKCQWEVLYMGFIECFTYALMIATDGAEGAVLTMSDGRQILWIRYAAWLITCPVLLIMLTNVAGPGKYDLRKTMLLLVVDQIMIVFGVTSAFVTTDTRYAFLAFAFIFGIFLFLMCAFIFMFAGAVLPVEGQTMISIMKIMFVFWGTYPLYFVLGPDIAGTISQNTNSALHGISDLFAKNIYSYCAWNLRWNVLPDTGYFDDEKAGDDSGSDAGGAGGKSVLVVEPEGSKYEGIVLDALEEIDGLEVETCEPREAKKMLRDGNYDVVMVNCTKKNASGFNVADKIRQASGKYRSTPMLAFVDPKKLARDQDSDDEDAFTMDNLREECTTIGIDATIEIKKGRISASRLEKALDHVCESDDSDDSDSDDSVVSRRSSRRSSRRKASRRRDDSDDEEAPKRRSSSRRGRSSSRKADSRGRSSSRKASSTRRASRASSKSSQGGDGIRKQSSSVGKMLSFFDGTK